ncbi:MAG: glutamyl-tRNA reductase [Candidatus Latescibacterota bacterium]
MHLLTLGLNHRTAPVEIREQLAVAEESQPAALAWLLAQPGTREAAILSTCNRSELYLVGGEDGSTTTRRFLTEWRGLNAEALQPHLYLLRDLEAARHLLRVAGGVDSLVLGESQILSQVRQALETAQRSGAARGLLNELFQRALHTGKRARTETDIARGRLSISTAAVELAGQVFTDLSSCSALLLGAGEMSELTAQYLMDSQVKRWWVANRTSARAEELARRFGGVAVPFAELPERLAEADIVLSSTAAPGFVLGPELLVGAMRRRRGRPIFLIDIAVPRDVDPAVRGLDNVFLFDIDDLEQVVATHRQEREQEIRKVEDLIAQELGGFQHWLNALDASPLIRGLQRRAEELRQTELDRWRSRLEHLSEEDRAMVEQILRGYANKLLHVPLVEVKRLANAEDGHLRLEAIRRLFGLELEPDVTLDPESEEARSGEVQP